MDTLFGYTGRDWDADVGLQYNRARWYDPSQGRWLSQDPIGFAAGDANLCRYVGNGPVDATDPSGLEEAKDELRDLLLEEWGMHMGFRYSSAKSLPVNAFFRTMLEQINEVSKIKDAGGGDSLYYPWSDTMCIELPNPNMGTLKHELIHRVDNEENLTRQQFRMLFVVPSKAKREDILDAKALAYVAQHWFGSNGVLWNIRNFEKSLTSGSIERGWKTLDQVQDDFDRMLNSTMGYNFRKCYWAWGGGLVTAERDVMFKDVHLFSRRFGLYINPQHLNDIFNDLLEERGHGRPLVNPLPLPGDGNESPYPMPFD